MSSPLLVLLGGLAVFLHGLDQAKGGLQLAAGDRLRRMVGAMTRNRLVGAGTGMLVTVVIQSSTAVTLMVVDYCAAGMCTFSEALAVLLGAGFGTTLIVQLISFRLANYALAMVVLGVSLVLLGPNLRSTGRILIGLGLLFFGLEVMSSGAEPVLRGEAGAAAVAYLAANPALSVVAAALATVALQGSAPTIGLVLSVTQAGAMSLEAALPFVLGANIGTTLTPLLHALAKPLEGRRAAVANVAIKVAGALLCLPFLGPLAWAVARTTGSPARQVANAHSLYNLAIAVLGLAFLEPLSAAVLRFYDPKGEGEPFRARHLAPEAIDTPALAFGQAVRELLNMADLVADMLREVLRPLQRPDLDLCDVIEAQEAKVDVLNKEIRFYLARIGSDQMTPAQSARRMQLINACSDLENIGDVLTKSIVPRARRRAGTGAQFSEQDWAELSGMHTRVCGAFETALAAFATGDEEVRRRAARELEAVRGEEERLRRSHIERLTRNLRESVESSSLHLDVVSDLGRVGLLLEGIVQAAARPAAARAE